MGITEMQINRNTCTNALTRKTVTEGDPIMAIDVLTEQMIPLKDYPRYHPLRNGKRLSRYAGYRHALRGIKGVKLETVQLPSGRYTSVEAVQRFFAALTVRVEQNGDTIKHEGGAIRRSNKSLEQQIEVCRLELRNKQKT
jgi:hypothetical protein